MGVFGGIIVGLGVAALHNRFYKIELPRVFSFFGGTHFIPIISAITYVGIGILMFYIWHPIQVLINDAGKLVLMSGYGGTLVYGSSGTRPDSFWAPPCFLYAFLADRCRRS